MTDKKILIGCIAGFAAGLVAGILCAPGRTKGFYAGVDKIIDKRKSNLEKENKLTGQS